MSVAARMESEPAGKRLRMDDRLAVSPSEAARLLGLSTMTVYRMCRARVIPGRKLGKCWLIPVDALRQILTDAETR